MRLVALMSSGIDSPVAAYKMVSLEADVVLLHMDNRPYAEDDSSDDVKALAERLSEVTEREMPLYFAPHGPSQNAIARGCDRPYQCVMCKRVMQRTARELAKILGCSGIVMGDSLGQVASQTLRNIRSENIGLDFPVVRPLIGMDKIEIEAVAKAIGTYDISIRPGHGCGIVPLRPITEADPEKVIVFSERIDLDDLARTSAEAAVRVNRGDSVVAPGVKRRAGINVLFVVKHIHRHTADVPGLHLGDVQELVAHGDPDVGLLGPLDADGDQRRAHACGADAEIALLRHYVLPDIFVDRNLHETPLRLMPYYHTASGFTQLWK